jgi:predicted small integral membrane protein
MNFTWMMWTWQTGLFFALLFAAIIFNGIMAVRRPVVERKGFLPIATTPGDRLFIGLISSMVIILLWLAFVGYSFLGFISILTFVWFAVESKWG